MRDLTQHEMSNVGAGVNSQTLYTVVGVTGVGLSVPIALIGMPILAVSTWIAVGVTALTQFGAHTAGAAVAHGAHTLLDKATGA